jgi:hypothetical protein
MHDEVHLAHCEVSAENFDPTIKISKRPDADNHLAAAHAALSHGEWAQQKVAAARQALAAGTKKVIEADDRALICAAKQSQRDAL